MSNARNLANLLGTDTQIQTADIADDAVTIGKLNDNATQLFGFRNRIINGDMRISQAAAGAAVTVSDGYPVDRFRVTNSTDGAFSAQQDSSAPTGFVNSVKVTTTTADGTLTTTQALFFRQQIEGTSISDLGWGTVAAQTVTLSFWVRSSLTGTFGGSLRNSDASRSYPFTYTISAADTWEQKAITIAGDTTGTWLTTNGVGIQLSFGLGVGPDRSGTAGAWAGANLLSATGAVSVVGTSGATFYITGVQLEAGSVATPFERRDYGRELIMCQRYYERVFISNSMPITITHCFSTSSAYGVYAFKVDKRATPTGVTSGSFIALTANGGSAGGGLSFDLMSVSAARLQMGGATGLVAGSASSVWGDINPMMAFSAEL